jgi:hypothetical protein
VIDGKCVPIELHVCADWKFLALVLGLNCANSTWFCLWCLCRNDERHKRKLDWKTEKEESVLTQSVVEDMLMESILVVIIPSSLTNSTNFYES